MENRYFIQFYHILLNIKNRLIHGAPRIILSHKEFKQLSINASSPSIDEYFVTIIMATFARVNLAKIGAGGKISAMRLVF